MSTGIPIIDAMFQIILAALYAIIFAVSFIIGFYECATPAALLGL